MFGRHAGEHRNVVDATIEFVVVHTIEVGAGDSLNVTLGQTEFLTDCSRCDGVVAGDHLHRDAGLPRFGDCRFGLGARRIDNSDEREQNEVADEFGRVGSARGEFGPGVERNVALCDSENTKAFAAETIVVSEKVGCG